MGETGCARIKRNEFTTRSQRKIVHNKGRKGHKERLLQPTLCGLCGLCCELFCLCDLVCRSLAFALTLPVMNRQGVAIRIKDGGHSAPGKIQWFYNKLGPCVFEFLDRLIEIGDF
jgi:hypothetical protein